MITDDIDDNDYIVLVVSAVPAELDVALSKEGQARKHLVAAAAMVGIARYIVAVTKMDLVEYKKEDFERVCIRVKKEMTRVGIQHENNANVIFLPLSGLETENIYFPSPKMAWTKEKEDDVPTFVQAIDRLSISRLEQLPLPFRLMVDAVHRLRGVGLVVCGVVTYGKIAVGDHVSWGGKNGQKRARIKSIEKFHTPAATCEAGDMVGIALDLVSDEKDIGKGDVLGAVTDPPTYTTSIGVKVTQTTHKLTISSSINNNAHTITPYHTTHSLICY